MNTIMKRVTHPIDRIETTIPDNSLFEVAKHTFDISDNNQSSMLLEQIGSFNNNEDITELLKHININIKDVGELSYMSIPPSWVTSSIGTNTADGQLFQVVSKKQEHQLLVYRKKNPNINPDIHSDISNIIQDHDNPRLQSLTFMDSTHDYLVTEVLAIAKGISNMNTGLALANEKFGSIQINYVRSEVNINTTLNTAVFGSFN